MSFICLLNFLVAKYVWSIVSCAFGIPSAPVDVNDLCGNWENNFDKRHERLILIGCATICWFTCKTRNAVCYQNKLSHDPSELIVTNQFLNHSKFA